MPTLTTVTEHILEVLEQWWGEKGDTRKMKKTTKNKNITIKKEEVKIYL